MKKNKIQLPRHALNNSMKAPAIIFIHGLSGSPLSTWSDMIHCFASDESFEDFALDCYAFPTRMLRLPLSAPMPGLRSISDGLRTFLDEKHAERASITLVGHSLGGLVARQFIVSETRAGRPLRVKKLALIAVPNNGSMLANVGRALSFQHRQLKLLTKDDEALASLNVDWEQLKIEESLPVRYIVGGCDRVVPHESAVLSADQENKSLIIDSDHRSIIRPNDTDDLRYLTLSRFLGGPRNANPERAFDGETKLPSRTPDPLFDAYTVIDKPFYISRAIDKLIERALGNGHLWLCGTSGVGKTACLRRSVYQGGWRLNHINLGGFEVDTPIELFKALAHELAELAGLERRIGTNSDFGECCSFLMEALRQFPNDITVANVVEELPLSAEELIDFADLVGMFLERLSTDASLHTRVVFAFSSIRPLDNIKAKTREKVQVIGLGTWSNAEALQLVQMLSPLFCPQLTPKEQEQIVKAAGGSPRFIKHLFRMWRNETAGQKNLTELLSQTKNELVQ